MLLIVLLPAVVSGFDLNRVIDTVLDEAVKSGIGAIEEELDKYTVTVEKDNDDQNATQTQPPGTASQDVPASPGNQTNDTANGMAAALHGSRFSNAPIDPEFLPRPVTSFSAGEHIYGILKCNGSWKQATGDTYILMYLLVDGKQKAYKSVGMKRPDLYNSNYFIIDIAPAPDKMVNYQDRDIVWPEKDGLRFGPEMFTKILSELAPGAHTIRLEVKSYGKIHAAAEFTITGDNYYSYATLLAGIKAGAGKQEKMPRVGMRDIALEEKMAQILKNSGWASIERLVIVDKDWWLDRQSGGNSLIVSRHIEAAVAAKDIDGTYYYNHVTFHEYRLITGGWGTLQLTSTGEKKPIPQENIHL